MEMLVGVVRRLKPKNGKPVNGAVEIIGVWKPAVNGGPRRCAKNPVNGVRRDGCPSGVFEERAAKPWHPAVCSPSYARLPNGAEVDFFSSL